MKKTNLINGFFLYTLILFSAPGNAKTEYQFLNTIRVSNSIATQCQDCEHRSEIVGEKLVLVWSETTAFGWQVFFRPMTTDALNPMAYSPIYSVEESGAIQSSPRIVADDANSMSIYWIDDQQRISVQMFNTEGVSLGKSSVLVDSETVIENLQVKKLHDGSRLLLWSSEDYLDEHVLKGLRLNDDNSQAGSEFEVARASSWSNGRVNIISMRNGNYWVAYESVALDGEAQLQIQVFSDTNESLSKTLVTDGRSRGIHGTEMQDGGVRLSWSEENNSSVLYSQRFDGNGEKEGALRTLDPSFAQTISHPKVSPLMDGSYIVTWREQESVFGKIYDYNDRPDSAVIEFNVQPLVADASNDEFSNQHDISISAIDTETFVAVWREGDAAGSDLLGKIFKHDLKHTVAPGQAVADAGPDILYHGNSTFYLNALRSADASGGDNLEYHWTMVSKPEGCNSQVGNANNSNASFYPSSLGEYLFDLEVVNVADGSRYRDQLAFNLFNNKPKANAGEDQQAQFVGSPLQLFGRNSFDVDGDYLGYHWTVKQKPENSAPVFDNPNSPTARFTPDVRGIYLIELTVSDSWSKSESDVIKIEFENDAPVAAAEYPETGVVGEEMIFNGGVSSDGNRDPLSYTWEVVSAPQSSQARFVGNGSVMSGLVPDVEGHYVFSLTVNDGSASSEAFEFAIDVGPAGEKINTAPIAVAGYNLYLSEVNSVAQLNASLSFDDEGDELTYSWIILLGPNGTEATFDDASSVTPKFKVDRTGTYTLLVTVSDGEFSHSDDVLVKVQNQAPTAVAMGGSVVDAWQTLTVNGSNSSDPNKEALAYQWSVLSGPEAHAAMFSDPAQVDPDFVADVGGVYVLQLSVMDFAGASATDTLTVTVNPAEPPVVDEPEVDPSTGDDEDSNTDDASDDAETDSETDPQDPDSGNDDELSAEEIAAEKERLKAERLAKREAAKALKIAQRAERKAARLAEKEAKRAAAEIRKAERAAKRKAEKEAKRAAAEIRKAERAAKRKAEKEAKRAAAEIRKAERAAKRKAEKEAKRAAAEIRKAERAAKRKAEKEAKRMAEIRKAEKAAKRQAEKEAKKR